MAKKIILLTIFVALTSCSDRKWEEDCKEIWQTKLFGIPWLYQERPKDNCKPKESLAAGMGEG